MTGKRSHCTVLSVTCEVLLWQVTSRRLSDPDRDVASRDSAVSERPFTKIKVLGSNPCLNDRPVISGWAYFCTCSALQVK